MSGKRLLHFLPDFLACSCVSSSDTFGDTFGDLLRHEFEATSDRKFLVGDGRNALLTLCGIGECFTVFTGFEDHVSDSAGDAEDFGS